MSVTSSNAFDALIARFEQFWQTNPPPAVALDPDWPSPCLIDSADEHTSNWRPVRRGDTVDFSGVEAALNLTLHPTITCFYGRYFSETLTAVYHGERVELVQIWNQDDTPRLLENLIGHLLMQRRLKQVETVFIATTSDEMAIISVVNNTGEVVLETLGQGITRSLAGSLAEFLDALEPASAL
jgi:SecY interacting protein Syd